MNAPQPMVETNISVRLPVQGSRARLWWFFGWMLAIFISIGARPLASETLPSEEIKVWEYSPYQVHLWYSFEPSITESEPAKRWFLNRLEQELNRTFRATWSLRAASLPSYLHGNYMRRLESLSLAELARNEIVLVVSQTHPETRTLRTYQAASETLTAIAASESTRASLSSTALEHGVQDFPATARLLEKVDGTYDSDLEIIQALNNATLSAAFLPRHQIVEHESIRVLPTLLPWQTEAIVNESDKLFFLSIGMDGDQYRLQTFEIDCPMQFTGPTQYAKCRSWAEVPYQASFAIRNAFAPVARVESAEATTAELRHRAGGLITEEDSTNPSRIRIGDVMQPMIRRDDRSGVPNLLQALSFTYAAVTESDGVRMQANVYTYSGGPGLRGRQNPRTQRVVLRVRPKSSRSTWQDSFEAQQIHSGNPATAQLISSPPNVDGQPRENPASAEPVGERLLQSALQIVVRGNPSEAQAGCFVYTKDHLTDEFTYIGRTDWRGQVTIPQPQEPIKILPAAAKVERTAAERELRNSILAQARQAHDQLVNQAQAEGRDPPEFVPPVIKSSEQPIDPELLISLNAPLLQLYVKSGETVVARLPFVPGLKAVEVAELPDDSLRLLSEAMVRGFQGEILDLIGQRNLLAARVRLHAQRKNLERASEVMEQLRSLKDFNQMNDELSRLQRSILEQTDISIPRSAQAQIDRMFKTTRDLLQKYLQQDIVADTARVLREASQ